MNRMREYGVSVDQLLRHYIFITEFIWEVFSEVCVSLIDFG